MRRSRCTALGQAAFRLISPSPDGARLATAVATMDASELRVYNLRTGGHVVWSEGLASHPVWNARGDRLIFGNLNALFAISPDQSGEPAQVYRWRGFTLMEAFAWDAEDRVIVNDWGTNRIVSLDLKTTPPSVAQVAPARLLLDFSPLAQESRDAVEEHTRGSASSGATSPSADPRIHHADRTVRLRRIRRSGYARQPTARIEPIPRRMRSLLRCETV